MLRGYAIAAWRHLVRHRLYSFIHLFGLAVGISFCVLSFVFVGYEHDFDTFHPQAERTYLAWTQQPHSSSSGTTPPVLAPTLREHVPQVEGTVRLHPTYGTTVRCGGTSLPASGYTVDPDFFQLFSFPTLGGAPNAALMRPDAAVIVDELAEACFGHQDATGQQVQIRVAGSYREVRVAAVIRVPANSSLRFDFLLPFSDALATDGWWASNVYTFVRAAADIGPAQLESVFDTFFGQLFAQARQQGGRYFGDSEDRLRLMPLTNLHLNTSLRDWPQSRSHPAYSLALTGIGLADLLIACVNCISLSLGMSATRLREIGVRKILSARRLQLAGQFCSEAALTSLLATLAGIGLAELCLPELRVLTARDLTLDYAAAWPLLLATFAGVALVTGGYPASCCPRYVPSPRSRGPHGSASAAAASGAASCWLSSPCPSPWS